MVTKTIKIDVNDRELDDLNSSLNKTKRSIDAVEGSAAKADNKLGEVGKNGGAIATLDALTGGLATRVRDAAEASKLFSFNLKGIRTALIATGIGAFVVALGLVVAYWDDIKSFVTGVNVELNKQLELQQELVKQAEFDLQLQESSENILRLQGKTEGEILELKKERLRQVIRIAEEELLLQQQQLEFAKNSESTIKGQGERFLRFFGKVTLEIAKMLDKATGGIFGFSTFAGSAVVSADTLLETIFGNEDTIKEIEGNIDALTLKVTQARDKLAGIQLSQRGEVRGADQQRAQVLPTTGVTLGELETLGQVEFDALFLLTTARNNLEESQSNYRIWLAEQEAKAKTESYMLAANGFAAASELIGRETAAGKAFAVASTLASTYLAAQQAYASQLTIPTPDAPVRAALAAATAVASGLANVKNILAVKVPGQGGGGSIGGGSPSRPPSFNVVANNPQNQLNQSLLEQNNRPVEAFVVDKPMTTAQELRRNKIQSSSI